MTEIAKVHDSRCIDHQRSNGHVKTNGQGIFLKKERRKKILRDKAKFPLFFVHLRA